MNFLDCVKQIKSVHREGTNIVYFASSDENAIVVRDQLSFLANFDVLYLPSIDILPYDRLSPPAYILSERARILTKLSLSLKPTILITNISNVLLKYDNKRVLASCYKKITRLEKIQSFELEKYLFAAGYQKTSSAIDPGEFARRGDIVDIVCREGEAYRINFAWDYIESIKSYDVNTQISNNKVDFLEIYPASEVLLSDANIKTYKDNFLKFFGIKYARGKYFEEISQGIKAQGIESVSSMFYAKPDSLLDYIGGCEIFCDPLTLDSASSMRLHHRELYDTRVNNYNSDGVFFPAPPVDFLLQTEDYVSKIIRNAKEVRPASLLKMNEGFGTPLENYIKINNVHKDKIVILTACSLSGLEQIKNLLSIHEQACHQIDRVQEAKQNIINIAHVNFAHSYEDEKILVVAEKDILGVKSQAKQKSSVRLKNILREIESFEQGDLVVHVEHGIGRFETIEQLEVEGIKHDCLKILYLGGDRLYIPVENIELIKKYGESEVELDKLGSTSWQRRTAKLKSRIGELANELVSLAAKRKLLKVEAVDFDQTEYEVFCKKFPYPETEDQLSALGDISEDLAKEIPMDRLICGDVGFGKTEVAMRAAFMVASSKKRQVVVIVPTTILSRQHYNNFVERFIGSGLKIVQISRFVSSKDIKINKEAAASGEANIIIGTHAILSDDVKFANLGLLIIDEEQHFGVVQKEKLKKLKSSVHNLTLSATPIPRTLQMSLLGIKDLSLIATPPIDRLAVRTSLVPYDSVIIREALMREKSRGGKSFFVAPRVSDLSELEEKLKIIAPELVIKMVHGQMGPKIIDDVMSEFYEGKFDVLLSTAIVESGLDIPGANTIMLYKPDMFGMSQIYQLRGRVGRGKTRGYCYLISNAQKKFTPASAKRIEMLLSLESLGSGFSLASFDMDSRGFGNLVGDEQSGHIKEVGTELYQEMLEEAMASPENSENIGISDVSINIKVPVYIPDNYIQDIDLRLGVYRRIGDIKSVPELEEYKNELIDRFGVIPESLNNLLSIIRLKIIAKQINILSLDVSSGGIKAQFQSSFDHNRLLHFIKENGNLCKIRPNNILVYMMKIAQSNYIKEAEKFLHLMSA